MTKTNTLTLDLYPVIIRRSKNEEVGGLFPKHEIPILKAVHRGKIEVGKHAEDDKEYTISAEAEYARLLKAYYRVNSTNPVPSVFLNGPEDLEQFGFEAGRGDLAQGVESLSINHKTNARKEAAAKANAAAAAAAAKAEKDKAEKEAAAKAPPK